MPVYRPGSTGIPAAIVAGCTVVCACSPSKSAADPPTANSGAPTPPKTTTWTGSPTDTTTIDTTVELPDVLENLALLEWTPVSTNTLADVDPCPSRDCAWSAVEGQSAVFNDWTGGAYASEEGELGGLVYFGGGHNGYYGNEVYFFDIATLTWERRIDPTDGEVPGDPTTYGLDPLTGLWWDGRPLSFHTYDGVSYDPVSNSFVLLTVGDAPALPWNPEWLYAPVAHRFSLDLDDWVVGTDRCADCGYYAASSYDPNRQLFWFWPQGGYKGLSTWDPATDTWTSVGPSHWLPEIDATGAVDPTRDLFVVLEYRGTGQTFAFDLDEPDHPTVVVSTTGDVEVEAWGQNGFEWCEALDGFLTWGGGASLYVLHPPDGDWRTESWVWERLDTTGTPPADPPPIYSKFQVVPAAKAAFVGTSRDGPVYAIRVAE